MISSWREYHSRILSCFLLECLKERILLPSTAESFWWVGWAIDDSYSGSFDFSLSQSTHKRCLVYSWMSLETWMASCLHCAIVAETTVIAIRSIVVIYANIAVLGLISLRNVYYYYCCCLCCWCSLLCYLAITFLARNQ